MDCTLVVRRRRKSARSEESESRRNLNMKGRRNLVMYKKWTGSRCSSPH